ncbi:SMI1/KNR4 family protein [Streptomyces sp. NPDC057062]|uniref:SMI1/KNR4 family protein n=1 Tax=unclassified Streptomyces TaxID=2593676 RepID=UPI001C6EA2D6
MSSNDDEIAQAERCFGVRFPEDYRHFLATEGSMSRFIPPADDFLMINAMRSSSKSMRLATSRSASPGASSSAGTEAAKCSPTTFGRNLRLWSYSMSPLRTGRPPSTRQLRSLPCSSSSPKPDGNGTTLTLRLPDLPSHVTCA